MYRAVTDSGQVIEGVYEANSEWEVLAMLRSNEYIPISIEYKEKENPIFPYFTKKITKRDLAVFCRQFYTMLNAGVTIVKCLNILEAQTENKVMRKATRTTLDDVQKGMTLSEAMRKHDTVFPNLLVNMVEAGEISGNLDIIMERMAMHYEKENKIENKIKGAMIYPIVLGVVSIAVVIFLLVAVMPTFINMFESSGVELPAPTRILLNISNSLQNQWYIYLASILVLVLGVGYFGRQESGRLFIDSLKLCMPVIKNTNIKVATSRFTRTLSTLLSSGIPLLQALDVVSKIVNNKFLSYKLENAKEEVRKGVLLSRAIKEIRTFPPMVDSMIKIGEESGSLDEVLCKSADFYDEEVETAVQQMTEILQPILVIIMALIVGFIVIAMALPMFDMVNAVHI
ncbi:type II secretion system F family protein [Proteiniborus sp. DW1]|uniref:type II secretion system F family protein n=1 Tax=Proteiniborus sp. DW1 TaxID=1889883 RepID=UPI000945D919|nr:type II secretion system F family protein [Proteiniborus sp. DW1]